MNYSQKDMDEITKRQTKLPDSVKSCEEDIRTISRFVWSHPELGSEEHECSAKIVEILKRHQFSVKENYEGMKTAFLASRGEGRPIVALLAEYDALPIGHGCGHNLIGAWGAGVGMALAKSRFNGTIMVVGTPAEEGHGSYASSKVRLAPKLKEIGVDSVWGVHPQGQWKIGGGLLAATRYSFVFKGKDAHAAASPHLGLNALDAAVNFYTGYRMMRTLVKRDKDVIMSAIIKDGGTSVNTIPGRAEVWLDLRANDSDYVRELLPRIFNVAKSAAAMAGCEAEYKEMMPMLESFKRWPALEEILYSHATEYVQPVVSGTQAWLEFPVASSDMCNISQILPTAQLGMKIGREDIPGHSEEWRDAAGTPEAEEALLSSVAIAHDAILDYASRQSHSSL